MRTPYQMPRSYELTMNCLKHTIQCCHQRHKKPHLMWKQAQVLFGDAAASLCYDVDMDSYGYKDERIQELCEQNIIGILTQLVDQMDQLGIGNRSSLLQKN